MDINNDYDDLVLNEDFHSECCKAPIMGEIIDDLAICSQCREWCGVIQEAPSAEEE